MTGRLVLLALLAGGSASAQVMTAGLHESSAPVQSSGLEPPAPPELRVKRALDGQPVQLKTKDGWTLAATHRPSSGGLTFLFVHMLGGRRHDWDPLARVLPAMGHGYLAFDLRGHGESAFDPLGSSTTWRKFKKEGQDNEFNQMVEDVAAAAVFLSSAGVAESSVVVCGASLGANVALKWLVQRSSAPMAILLSPGINYKDVLSVAAMRALGPRACLIVAGESDRKGYLEGQLLYQIARQFSGPAYAEFVGVRKEHGTKMLAGDLVQRLLAWVRSPVKAELLSLTPVTAGVAASSGPASSTGTAGPFGPPPPPPPAGTGGERLLPLPD